MGNPNVLIISNQPFSQSNSNGRTLRNFFAGWSAENIAQFYIHGDSPDFSSCKRFFKVTDRKALDAFLGRGNRGGPVCQGEAAEETKLNPSKDAPSRTPVTMLLREIVWNSRRWMTKEFKNWVAEFSPDVVLLQAGDSGFMFSLAKDIAEECGVPLVIYNSEGYYFKKFDYLKSRGIAHLLYPIFRRYFCRRFRKTMAQTAHTIYICPALKADYDKEFDVPSDVVFTATGIALPDKREPSKVFTASYLGNLGVGRHEGLVEIANALQSISRDLYLDVYGRIPNEQVQKAFDACSGIRYRGFVSYEEVISIMHKSDLIVHTENFSEFYREDLKYAFSTKIADSLASGTCFLLYAPEEIACARYLRENDAAYVVSEKHELKPVLQTLVNDSGARSRYLAKAESLVTENHREQVCAKKFRDILIKVAEDKNESSPG